MAVKTAYTLDEARQMLADWKACAQEFVSGQVMKYRIGTREIEVISWQQIKDGIEFFSNLVEVLEGQVRTTRVVRVVPRDL